MYKNIFRLFVGVAITGLFTYAAQAETAQEFTSEKYLNNHGHSTEVSRLVTLQKKRTEYNEATPAVHNSKIRNFFKNVIIHSDLTKPVDDFGFESIK